MYKVLLVDDEMIVRVGVKSIGEWEKNGMEIVAEASDGKQALELFEKINPDLIITDIRMPEMDGIELLRSIRKHDKNVRILMLSNYAEKEYLIEALRLGANDFIMKNELNANSIQMVLENQRKELDRLDSSKKESSEPTKKWRMKEFVINLMSRSYTDASITREFSQHLFTGETGDINAVLIYFNFNQPNTQKKGEKQVLSIVEGAFSDYFNCTVAQNERLHLVGVLVAGDVNREKLNRSCIAAKNALKMYANSEVFVGISSIAYDTETLIKLAEQAEHAMLYASLTNSKRPVEFEQCKESLSNTIDSKEAGFLKMLYIHKTEDIDRLKEICREIIRSIELKKCIQLKRQFCIELGVWYNRYADLISARGKTIPRFDAEILLYCHGLDQMEDMVMQYIFCIQNETEYEQGTGNETVEKVKAYVMREYSGSITLGSAASLVHLSKSYLSTLFSEVCGVSFSSYLMRFRINKAAELLVMTELRIQEIAWKTGFVSERYFSQSFKKTMGVTPTIYRKLAQKTEN